MRRLKNDEVRKTVRETYGRTAEADGSGCGCAPSPCCGSGEAPSAEDIAVRLGYSREDASAAPAGANMGLGCGNPQAIASLQPGETVLDLGSGGGFDCFLAAKAVGETGRVIGVDMTPEMVARARENAAKAGLDNVEFRLGEIEHLPVPDASVDIIISNCVVNLSPEKPEVFQEAFRVLRPGGRLAITDVVATAELPESVKNDLALHAGCVAGAAQVSELKSMLADAGFSDVHIRPLDRSRELIAEWAPGEDLARFIASATVEAVKPPSV